VNISADLDVNSSHDESNLRHGIVIVNDTPRLTCSPANSDTSVHGSHGLPFIRNAEIIPVGESAVLYIANLCPDPEGWMEQLLTLPWSPERLKMYGKQLELKRETIHYGVAYDFNPESKPPLQWDDKVLILRDLLTETTGIEHEQCACNLYPDGMTNIGCHHDKQHPVSVTSASFGAYRQMGFRVGEGADVDRSLPLITLEPGSLLLFSGDFNTKYKHGLLTDKAVKEPRISITFRHFAEVMQE
jgi:alkylated DNA repair dioxygenase AlkB